MTPLVRLRAASRVFPAWYAACLGVLLLGVELGRAARGPDAAAAVPTASLPVEAVMALPPKPETETPTAVDGGGDEAGYTWERCERLSADFADACFAALARQRAERDPDGGLEACARIADGELRQECHADVAEGHARVDVDRSFTICDGIERKKWRDQCVFGIAMAYALTDPTFALATCEKSGQWRPFCRHDVNGERAVVDPDGAVAYCASLDPARQDTCWHGVGKYIGRVDTARALAVCDRAPLDGDLRGQCVHGVGWAAAERSGSAAAVMCEPLGAMRDSCILGVAYHARRFDPEHAAALCGTAEAAAERRRCLDFVGRR